MNREHPTGTERKSLNYECGWKGGDRAAWLNGKNGRNCGKNRKRLLTGIGLLMEGARAVQESSRNFGDQQGLGHN
jgi:hypothetical protein